MDARPVNVRSLLRGCTARNIRCYGGSVEWKEWPLCIAQSAIGHDGICEIQIVSKVKCIVDIEIWVQYFNMIENEDGSYAIGEVDFHKQILMTISRLHIREGVNTVPYITLKCPLLFNRINCYKINITNMDCQDISALECRALCFKMPLLRRYLRPYDERNGARCCVEFYNYVQIFGKDKIVIEENKNYNIDHERLFIVLARHVGKIINYLYRPNGPISRHLYDEIDAIVCKKS